jgi:hypothetical protein
VKQDLGGLGPDTSVLPSPVSEKPEDLCASPPGGPKAQTMSKKSLAGSPSGLPRRRVGLIKANKLGARTQQGPQDQIPPLQDKQLALAAIKKLFRQMNLPGQCDSAVGSTPKCPDADDFHELGDRLRERLDAVFPDDSAPVDASPDEIRAEELVRLQATMGKLQLGPTHTLKAFARELERLRPVFAKKRRMLALIDLQAWLCRRLIRQPGRTHRLAAIAFFKGFSAIERLATERGLSAADEQLLVGQVVAEFKNFNNMLTKAGTDRKCFPAPEVPIRSAHPVAPVERLIEFLKEEISGIENLLRSQLGDREKPTEGRSADSASAVTSAGRNRPKYQGHP